MLTDKKTVLVACSNVPKDKGSDDGRHVSVGDGPPREFRNHLGEWLAVMTTGDGVAAVVPEIVPTPSKSASDGRDGGTTNANVVRLHDRVVTAKISRS